MGSSAMMGLQLVFSSILLACCVVGHQRHSRDKTDRRNAFGTRPHDIVAVPDLDFAQEPHSEAEPVQETRPAEDEYYNNYQTDFLSSPGQVAAEPQYQHQQYPVLAGLQTGHYYPSHYGANNFYVKPSAHYYGNRVETPGNTEGSYYCRNYYGYLQPCHSWSNTIAGWWTDN